MKAQIIGYTFLLVIIINSLSCEANGNFAVGNIDDIISKRRYQRRNLLQSFCARRCNRGLGGNVCRCNGFHFAGKRSSPYDDTTDDDKPEDFPNLYNILSDTDNVLLSPEEETFSTSDLSRREDDSYQQSLHTILSELLNTVKIRTYDDELKHMIDDFLTSQESQRDI